ncbi:glutamate receptor ionotropic, kainate glr-3-like [Periplaneta americana]|uniref:glutamate receptor ionotropic, kainate glr-3-like n=1 Tax=Periplaneta americana TaxID=6978 RepID=UPI0037E8CD52
MKTTSKPISIKHTLILFQFTNLAVPLLPVMSIAIPEDAHRGFVSCAKQCFSHVQSNTVTVLTTGSSDNLHAAIIQELHESGNSVVLSGGGKSDSFLPLPEASLEDAARGLQALTEHNSRAKVVLTIDADTVPAILTRLHLFNVVNAVVLSSSLSGSGVDAFSWAPYQQKGECDRRKFQAVKLGRCCVQMNEVLTSERILAKELKHMHGCSIRAATFPWPPFIIGSGKENVYTEGLEIKLMNMIAEGMNATVEYLPPPANDSKWGDITASGEWTGLLGAVFYGRADVAFASMTATEERMLYFEPTDRYWSNSVVWVVPRPQFISDWRRLVGIFSPALWWAVVVAYLVDSLLLWRLARSTEPATFRNVQTCLLATLALALDTGTHRQPRGAVVRFVFFCWMIHSMEISTAYKSSLISVLTNPRLEPAITNTRQLLNAGLSLRYTLGLSQYFEDKHLLSFCDNITACLDRVAFAADSALISDKWYVEYLTPRLYLDKGGDALLQTMSEHVLSYHVVMILSKGSLMLDRFNELISRISEGGMLNKWMKDIKYKKRLGKVSQNDDGGRTLGIHHLKSVFAFLLIGQCLGILSLLVEVMLPRLLKKYSRDSQT